jgi:hypothetical protein
MKPLIQKQMKNFSFKSVLLLAAVFMLFNSSKATNVSGGIYTNTTWTLAGSPYIVTSNIVVFPGVILTIQPGVVVKFDNNTQIEIREAKLLAVGNATDSITFTSNAGSPTPGIYRGVYILGDTIGGSSFHYCSFTYADTAIYVTSASSLDIQNSYFGANTNGPWDEYGSGTATVSNCNFVNNAGNGLYLRALISASINNCNFFYNGTGLWTAYYHATANNCLFEHNYIGLTSEYLLLNNSIVNNNQMGEYSMSENTYENSTFDSNAVYGISANGDSVVHCVVYNNGVGIYAAVSVVLNSDIEHNDSSNINDNGGWGGSVITGNTIKYSATGIDNVHETYYITYNDIEYDNVGIKLSNDNSTISCNSLCNNSSYALYYTGFPNNINVENNYWCTADSAHTQPLIYDGYVNISYGLAIFMPIDTAACAHACTNYYVQDICIVTTDTAINKNVIVWGRSNSPAHGSWNVYDSTVSGWVKIGSVPDTALSEFVDTASHPNLQAYSYRITTVDSCGESAPSSTNTSIYLQVAQLTGRDSLYWTHYVGFGTPMYLIYRGLALNALTLIDSVPGTDSNFVDLSPPAGSIYLVEAVNPGGPCIPTHSMRRFLVGTSASISNGGVPKAPAGVNGLTSAGTSVHVYPNPNNGQFTIQATSQELMATGSVEVYNMLGEKIYSHSLNINNSTSKINLSSQPDGVYMYRVLTEAGSLASEGRFVIQK